MAEVARVILSSHITVTLLPMDIRSTFRLRLSRDSMRQILLPAVLLVGLMPLFLVSSGMRASANPIAARPNEFLLLTQHVEVMLTQEKRQFYVSTTCTEWFYKLQQRKPVPPAVEPIRWRPSTTGSDARGGALSPSDDCPRLFPNGLEQARRAFSGSQAALSLGLTFYEFALVAYRDDDQFYSGAELADLLDAMILPSVTAQMDAATALKATFDTWLSDRNLEQIMNSMGRLYDHGYRLTQADRTALDRVMQ